MEYYIVPAIWLFVWTSILVNYRVHSRPSISVELLGYLPLLFVAAARGNIGTDTATYLQEINLKISGLERPMGEFEPGFELVIQILSLLIPSARWIVAALAVLNGILLILALRNWGRSSLIVVATVVPAFFFDLTMNGLRIGFAAPFCIFAAIAFEQKKYPTFILASAVALLAQMTSILLLGLLVLSTLKRFPSVKWIFYSTCGTVLAAYSASLIFSERVLAKVALYETLTAPSSVSGLAPLFLSLLSLAICTPLKCEHNTVIKHCAFTFLQFAFFQLSTLTYAGLRFQLLCLLAQFISLSRDIPLTSRNRTWIILISSSLLILILAWKMRGFYYEVDTGDSPFLPYYFVWESK